ncbi:malonic semialdehyde reductase [Paraburkholderia sp. CNPSo 3281]|uniref:malonic semialdehyde reductase n=1 Tax=Paraburkholderia sp. CNPSo 3281 TaxID=2940933 RepID=UPI0020B74DFA|nr:malonic semialdehyde reductase [Paraburkholderia sp. CNPSo 3281]MCP3717339.1 malonic semialdehyde reductase [Paraburkholderia sp. CNPSo 3281]
MSDTLRADALDTLFRSARSQNGWIDKPVTDGQLRALYDLAAYGPTSMNTTPARFLFLRTPQAKARLLPALAPGNIEKTRAAPVCVIVAYDRRFHDHLPALFPHRADARAIFEGKTDLIESTAFRNGTLQGAYLLLAARALGLDCGPMSGFDEQKVNDEFFPDGNVKVNFLCNIGYGDRGKLFDRLPRLPLEVACSFL